MVVTKLKSNKGVSITIALLLFLVCAVIGSIVLASATAASGRLSGLKESDRRYFAVTSAAELFRDALDGQSVTVWRNQSEPMVITWVNDEPQPSFDDAGPGSGDTKYGFSDEGNSSLSFLRKVTLDYVLGNGWEDINWSASGGDAKEAFEHTPGFTDGTEYPAIALTGSDKLSELPKVVVTATQKNNKLTFIFKNEGDDSFSLSFTLTPVYDTPLQMTADKDINSTVDVTQEGEEEKSTYQTTFTRVTTETVQVTWQVSAIRKEAA